MFVVLVFTIFYVQPSPHVQKTVLNIKSESVKLRKLDRKLENKENQIESWKTKKARQKTGTQRRLDRKLENKEGQIESWKTKKRLEARNIIYQ